MSRFSEQDRERIRSQLIEAGQESFARFGFERTRISDLTAEAEIGTSTFYQFFDSKEELYVKVLLIERRRLEENIADAVKTGETPRDEVRLFLQTMLDEIQSNPLISALLVDGELRTLQDQLEQLEADGKFDGEQPGGPNLPFTERWAALETFRYDDRDLIEQLFISLVFTVRAQSAPVGAESGVEYEQVQGALIETVVDGLFVES
ncbi:TetR/AcrR family transcriptional regulator [Halorubrum sp. ASP1]|uniref:TetR/AcrR family transcriptional regulator n=1 Tax=Halorubrum sp. ASP1 TaxID=2518114 RepID=UPI0010FA510A|nr:TetR/AcrR family transcriptional regulator [Halorubrum sp. ASP1]TKX63011.1 TetR/AcrR family transcriptional regulator [Halorubrum sp. ASP1]